MTVQLDSYASVSHFCYTNIILTKYIINVFWIIFVFVWRQTSLSNECWRNIRMFQRNITYITIQITILKTLQIITLLLYVHNKRKVFKLTRRFCLHNILLYTVIKNRKSFKNYTPSWERSSKFRETTKLL